MVSCRTILCGALLVLLPHVVASAQISFLGWHFLGPFAVGKNELDGDPLVDYGGVVSLFRAFAARKRRLPRIVSEIATGGFVSWQPVGDQETIHVRPENVNFNRLVQGLQSIEVQEVQGWAAAEFDLKRSGHQSISLTSSCGISECSSCLCTPRVATVF